MKGYVGRRDFDGPVVYVVTEKPINGGLTRAPLKHLVLHSPDGFEWGYEGSGPADLALAILANNFDEDPTEKELRQGYIDTTPEELSEELSKPDRTDTLGELMGRKKLQCLRYYQDFKHQFVAKMPKTSWKLTGDEIQEWIDARRLKEKS